MSLLLSYFIVGTLIGLYVYSVTPNRTDGVINFFLALFTWPYAVWRVVRRNLQK